MKKQVLLLHRGNYSLRTVGDAKLAILGDFLISDVSGCAPIGYYRKWLKNEEETLTGGNCSDLEKIDNNVVIKNIFDPNFGASDEKSLILSQKNLFEILTEWERLSKEKPAKIIIVQDGDNVTLEASNSLTQEESSSENTWRKIG